jgi:hypothetical protein
VISTVNLRRAVTAAAISALMVGAGARPSEAQAPTCNQVNQLIAQNPRYLKLEPGTYDNSCAELVVPNGYVLEGVGDSSMVVLPNRAGDLADVGNAAAIRRVRLQVSGVPNDIAPGIPPCVDGCGGVRLHSKAEIDHVRLQGSLFGFVIAGDHVRIRDSVSSKNFYGIVSDASEHQGNADLQGNDLTGNAQASIGISPWAAVDSAYMRNNHLGFSPYCWFAEGSRDTKEFAVSNVDSASESCESPVEAGYNFGDRRTSGIWMMPRTGAVVSGGPIWVAGGPAPSRVPGPGVQTLILAAGGDTTNGPMLAGSMRVHH